MFGSNRGIFSAHNNFPGYFFKKIQSKLENIPDKEIVPYERMDVSERFWKPGLIVRFAQFIIQSIDKRPKKIHYI